MQYNVAVRTLCEFVAKQGDLDLRFTPSPTAQEGIMGHGVVTSRREDPSYQREITLEGQYRHLRVRGRADGYDPELSRLEEIKTFRGDLSRMPANHRHLHWTQARIYGWLQCLTLSLTELELALVYFEVGTQRETVLVERWTAEALKLHFEALCERFLDWAEQELRHREARQQSLQELTFPYASFREGQRELAESVYKATHVGCSLMLQAPTGIGKTVGTLFPLLKAMPRHSLDKIFFLAAKGPGRKLALDSLQSIIRSKPTLSLRVLELKAREKACEYLDKACHGESCPLAKGFYDRLPLARRAILKSQMLMSYEHLRAIAIEHQVCPYYLSQDLARWSDVIVGDYNYYFDNSALLFALKSQNQWSVSVLVDEAHNLLERARGMYTASLDSVALGVLRKKGPAVLKKSLDKVNRCWKALSADQELTYQTYLQVPDKLLFALQQAVSAIADFFNDALAIPDVMLQRFYFDAIQFMRLAESFSNHSLFEIHKQAPHSVPQRAIRNNSTLTIRNVLPAPFLEPRFKAAVSTVLFSATIGPARFLKDTLGLDAATPWVNVRSPFAAEQLSVHLVNDISTRYKDRDRSLSPIAELMAWQYRKQPGNYLAFFSSFDYLEKAVALFSARFPNIPLWAQTRQMSEADRTLFIDRFTESSCGIGFAVLGGSFGEGIDLPGQRLIGAFIATLGLPQLNPVNEQIKLRLDLLFGAGYDYTYFYPGIQKVVQAAGRVIRTTTDRGVLYLIDDRFAQPNVRHLLPEWWSVRSFNWQTQLNHLSLAD